MDGKVSNDPFVQSIEERIHSVKQQEQEEREYMMFEMRLRQERLIATKEAAEKAHAEGKAEGKAEGEALTWVASAKNLMKNLKLTAQQAVDAVSVPMELRAKVLEQL